jgi:hypothetical protein
MFNSVRFGSVSEKSSRVSLYAALLFNKAIFLTINKLFRARATMNTVKSFKIVTTDNYAKYQRFQHDLKAIRCINSFSSQQLKPLQQSLKD